jgi:hypothetical protein
MQKGQRQQLPWPELDFDKYSNTVATVHLWAQIVGKIRLTNSPWLNHSWHVTLYVTPRGLSTHTIPYSWGIFELSFDFDQHKLIISTSEGGNEMVGLYRRSVASFYKELFTKMEGLGIAVKIYARPNEVEPAIPFDEDEIHQEYDPQQINIFWKALTKIEPVFSRFRAGFSGKCSPVHLFWGAFDLAVTRFSGREAPKHPGGMPNIPLQVMQEAYSHEVSSAGFWGGSQDFPQPCFYAYCYPTPATFGEQQVEPEKAFFSKEMGEFFLPYSAVQQSADPEAMLLRFLETTYVAAAETGNWDRQLLEFKVFQ